MARKLLSSRELFPFEEYLGLSVVQQRIFLPGCDPCDFERSSDVVNFYFDGLDRLIRDGSQVTRLMVLPHESTPTQDNLDLIRHSTSNVSGFPGIVTRLAVDRPDCSGGGNAATWIGYAEDEEIMVAHTFGPHDKGHPLTDTTQAERSAQDRWEEMQEHTLVVNPDKLGLDGLVNWHESVCQLGA